MQPLISEFSYGYALTEELTGGILGPLTGAPVFPSLRQEGQPGGGYDVQIPLIGLPLFLQFKLSDYLSRTTAREWPVFRAPYYRMHLRPLRHSDQHDLLLALEGAGNEVYYVAPEFHTQPELNSTYRARRVFMQSRFFHLAAIGPLPDRDEHYIGFRARQPAYLFSERGRKIPSQSGEELSGWLGKELPKRLQTLDQRYLNAACSKLLSIIREKPALKESVVQSEDIRQKYSDSRLGLGRYLAYISWVFFDSCLVFVGKKEGAR